MDLKTAPKPKHERVVSVSNARGVHDDSARRAAARKAYRAKIESLLGESADSRLADMWQRVCPFRIERAHDLPDRRAMIVDLADFAEVLQPNLEGMKPHRLCSLVERYASYRPRQADAPVSLPVRQVSGLRKQLAVPSTL